MGRRSFISMTEVKRLISASNARKKEKERLALINSQDGNNKEMPAQYSLQNIDFNVDTRIAKIDFLQTQQYRTIDRYVTQNHVRYPIYSQWKTRSKIIKKTLKLTNQELENLERNEDSLVRQYSKEIIIALDNSDLLPSWFLKAVNLEEHLQTVEKINSEYQKIFSDYDWQICSQTSRIQQYSKENDKLKSNLHLLQIAFKKNQTKINKIESSNRNPLKYIFSLFIYAYLISDRRKNKLISICKNTKHKIQETENLITQNCTSINYHNGKTQELNQQKQDKQQEKEKIVQKAYRELSKKQNAVSPLPISIPTDNDFITLKSIKGFSYEKIIGCYVIHNKEKNKYYVGQSKDVLKRLQQHFKGTVPNNIIFAEDYYSSSPDKRDNLFEVKIIPCKTKDELDFTEKNLIEKYDSFNAGYNGTSGNT